MIHKDEWHIIPALHAKVQWEIRRRVVPGKISPKRSNTYTRLGRSWAVFLGFTYRNIRSLYYNCQTQENIVRHYYAIWLIDMTAPGEKKCYFIKTIHYLTHPWKWWYNWMRWTNCSSISCIFQIRHLETIIYFLTWGVGSKRSTLRQMKMSNIKLMHMLIVLHER